MVVCGGGGCAFDCFSFLVGLAVFIVVRKSASLSVCVCLCVCACPWLCVGCRFLCVALVRLCYLSGCLCA